MRHTLVLLSTAASLAVAAPTKFGVTGTRPWNSVLKQDLAPHDIATRSLVEPDCISILRSADPTVLKALYKQSTLAGGDKQDRDVCAKLVARLTPLEDEDDETDCEDPTATASPTPTPTLPSGGGDDGDCDPEDPTPTPKDPNDCEDDGSDDDNGDDCSDDGSEVDDEDDCSDTGSEGGDESDDDCDEGPGSSGGGSSTSSASAPTPTPIDPPSSGGGESSSGGKCSKKYTVKSGDSCSAVAQQFGISLSDFYTWNPDVDSDCQNLDIGQSYCVN